MVYAYAPGTFERDTMSWLETITIRCRDKRKVMDLLQKIGVPEGEAGPVAIRAAFRRVNWYACAQGCRLLHQPVLTCQRLMQRLA